MDYKCFGDVVSFDTTFQTNKFKMPFAPILGTNHHKQTIIFGCALIFNGTIPSFVWLFESFLKAMSGKHPSTVFTDQDAAMATTIAHLFPNTAHRLCLWHIGQNVVKHLSPIIKEVKMRQRTSQVVSFGQLSKVVSTKTEQRVNSQRNGMNCWLNTTLRKPHGCQIYML
jgi:hypothetical protein